MKFLHCSVKRNARLLFKIFCHASFVLLLFSNLAGGQLAFPGAEGFGRFTTGGRGGRVVEVTNLNDSGPGSLRAAVQTSGSRTIIFRVSGTIHLRSRLSINYGNLTIAGQTAPGDGICIADQMVSIDADNVIIRYLRFRLGDVYKTEDDAFNGRNHQNIIIDHCSMSWSIDETASFYDNENFTLQWSLLSESLYQSAHSKGAHGYGGIWGGMGASFHHNLLAHHSSRNPRFNGSRYHGMPDREIVDFRNNVIYNWGGNSAYGGEAGNQNMIANYYKAGPATQSGDVQYRIVNPSDALGKWYIAENFVHGHPRVTSDNWDGGVQSGFAERDIRAHEPFPVRPILTQTAENAYRSVLADAGAVRPKRDPLDERIVHEVRTGTATYGGVWGTGRGIIDSQESVGGWPELTAAPAPRDDDHDGMADDWELSAGLDPADPGDRNSDLNGDGYTNLEEYINSLCLRDDYLMAPAELTATTISSSDIELAWKELTPNETGFVIERSPSDTTAFAVINTVAANDTSYMDGGLAPAELYFYRLRATNEKTNSFYTNSAAAQTLYSGNRPLRATEPAPANEAIDIDIGTLLSWAPAVAATSYDVYFGASNPPEFRINQVETTFDPRGLSDSTTYFWRVDPRNDNGATAGSVWTFMTELFTRAEIAGWPFDRGQGVIAQDATGHRNHARLQNMDSDNWIDGVSGTALSFNGADNFLLVSDSDWFDFSIRGFSVTFFIKQQKSDATMPYLSKVDAGRGFELASQGDAVRFAVSDGDKRAVLDVARADIATDNWVMVTAGRDRATRELFLYRNAQLLGTAPDSTWNLSNDADLYWATTASQTHFFAGALDEVVFYNYALDRDDIQSLYEKFQTDVRHYETAHLPLNPSLNSYPNPFNDTMILTFTLPEQGQVQVALYNALGQRIEVLLAEKRAAGRYSQSFNAAHLSSGVYILRMQSGTQTALKKVLLIR